MTDNQPTVRISDGALRGEKLESTRGGCYYSFKGIPYGKPPVGDLRFKAPVPVEPWTGIRDATKHSPEAPSVDMLTRQYIENSSEDCLYVNVYTPKIPESKNDSLKPVLVWVHGGGFSMGSGNSEIYGPDYLITEDVVLVTINYRLGALGFLSLQTEECPGNFGLKDQVLALKWVQRNISAFGGDPKNVTIFGESAGGASIQFLLISKLTKGLFHKAISQSGTALSPWSFKTNPRDYAFALGEALGLKTKDDKELLEFLKKTSAKDLVVAQSTLQKMVDPDSVFAELYLVPVVEPNHEGAFITKTPMEIIQSGDFNDVPYLIGVNTLEGLIFLMNKAYKESTADEDLKHLLPSDLHVGKDSPLAKEIIKKIRDRYFPNGFDIKKLSDVLSRTNFLNGTQKFCELVGKLKNRKSPTYFYQFSFDGDKGFYKRLLVGFRDWKGTCHGDELGYLFHVGKLNAQLVPDTQEYATVQRMTKLWTDFAKTGNPTPKDNAWKPVSENNFNYFEIGDNLESKKDFEVAEYKFWNEIYESAYKSNKSSQ